MFVVPERVEFENLTEVRADGEVYIDDHDPGKFDLSALRESNSAAAALLVAWFRYAHRHDKKVTFVGVPAALGNILEVTELAAVLPVETRAADAPARLTDR